MLAACRPVPDLSIVVIGKNAGPSLARVFVSIPPGLPDHVTAELIYVDSASTDSSVEMAGRFAAKVVTLSADQPLCASAGRYAGACIAQGELILFLDSDMELLPDWLPGALAMLEARPEVAAIGGTVVDCLPDGAPVHPAELLGSVGPESREVRFLGGASLYRRSLLLAVGNWNPYIISDEEPELCLRLRQAGYRIVKLQSPMVLHHGYAPPTIGSLVARRRRRLFLGSGQVIRYHLQSPLLTRYLKERGFALLPLFAVLLLLACMACSSALRTPWPGIGFWIAAALVYGADALRSRSLHLALYHLVHRAFICEGMLRGILLPYAGSQPYPDRGLLLVSETTTLLVGAGRNY